MKTILTERIMAGEEGVTDETAMAAVLAELRAGFGRDLCGVWLHGSAVSGGLRPGSDIDLLVVIDRPMTPALRRHLGDALMRLSAPYPAPPGGARCLEVLVFRADRLAMGRHPAEAEFVYGEWLRADFEAGEAPAVTADPEFTLVLAQARGQARALLGPPLEQVLPQVPAADIRRAMGDALPALMAGLQGDARNCLLTLARMWRTARCGDFVPKDVAAAWAMEDLPAPVAAVLGAARDGYLAGRAGMGPDPDDSVRHAADHLHARVVASL